MAYQDFYANPAVAKLVKELAQNKIVLEPMDDYDSDRNYNGFIRHFDLAVGQGEAYILSVLEKDYGDFYKFIFHRANDGKPRALMMVAADLCAFALLRYHPDSLERYLSFSAKSAKKVAKLFASQYNEALGLGSPAAKTVAKPKGAGKTAAKVVGPEAAYKYSEFDEDYYAMLFADPYVDGRNINPVCSCRGMHKESLLFEPNDQSLQDIQFLDFMFQNNMVLVSGKIKDGIGGLLTATERSNARPRISTKPFYFKAGDTYHEYFCLVTPSYKFMDSQQLKKTVDIGAYHDGTSNLGAIKYIVFKASEVRKVPPEERAIFRLDFHAVKWFFCLEHIKQSIQAQGATGVRFEKAKERDWSRAGLGLSPRS